MLCRLRNSGVTISSKARMATLVATEEFPIKASVSPKPSSPVAINSNKLENGVRTVTRESSSPFVALKFAIVGGSGTEGKNAKGAAHFLSKAAFAGNEASSGLKLVHSLESLGASIHAYSDKEKIVYDVKVLADRAEPVVSTVLSAIASPPHAAYVFEELRNTVQLDYNHFAADSSAQLRELVQEAAFGEASALGAPRLATNLKKLSVADVLAYRQAHFVRNNVVVAASGGISQGALDAAVSKHINAVPAGQSAPSPASSFVGGEVKVRVDLDGASRFGLAFPVPAGDAGKPYVVLNALLAGALAAHKSRASTYVQSFVQGGLIGVEASSVQQLEAFVAALKSIASKAPEVDVIKQKLTLEHFLALEGGCSSTVLLNAHLRGQNAQSAGDLRSVTAESVSAAAAAALKSAPAYAVLGATAGTPSYTAITKLL